MSELLFKFENEEQRKCFLDWFEKEGMDSFTYSDSVRDDGFVPDEYDVDENYIVNITFKEYEEI